MRGLVSQEVAEIFALPKNIIPMMMFSMGYPAKESKPHTKLHYSRKTLEETVTVI